MRRQLIGLGGLTLLALTAVGGWIDRFPTRLASLSVPVGYYWSGCTGCVSPQTNAVVAYDDFACGAWPNKYATILLDKRDTSDEQRGGYPLPNDPRLVDVDLNVFPWPFRDGEFDFSICCHYLEHCVNPVRACAELSRISKAGYIELPYWCTDVFIGNDRIHRWLCSELLGHIVFVNRAQFLAYFDPYRRGIFSRYLMHFRNIRIVWRGSITTKLVGVFE